MSCVRELRPYFICFFLFGQTSYIPSEPNHLKHFRLISIILKLFNLAIPFGSTILFVYNRSTDTVKSSEFNSFFSKYVIFVISLFTYLAFYTSYVNPNLAHDICGIFDRLIPYIERNLHIKIDIRTFKQRFRRKLCFKLSIEIFTSVLRYAMTDVVSAVENSLFTIMLVINIFGIFHLILYIDLIELLLCSINRKINVYAKEIWFTKRYTKTLSTFHRLKWIHYNLWKISRILNDKFGVLCIFFAIHFSVTFVGTLYRSFVYFPTLLMIGEY